MTWYKGSAGTFTVTTTEAFQEMIVLVISSRGDIAAKFAYPARVGHTELTKSGDDYSAIMTEAETLAANEGVYDVEVKLFFADGTRPVGKARISNLNNSTVGKTLKS